MEKFLRLSIDISRGNLGIPQPLSIRKATVVALLTGLLLQLAILSIDTWISLRSLSLYQRVSLCKVMIDLKLDLFLSLIFQGRADSTFDKDDLDDVFLLYFLYLLYLLPEKKCAFVSASLFRGRSPSMNLNFSFVWKSRLSKISRVLSEYESEDASYLFICERHKLLCVHPIVWLIIRLQLH